MAEGHPGDHRQDQSAHGADRQCVQRRAGLRQQAEMPERQAEGRDHHPEHRHVQRPEQADLPDALVVPARQAQQVADTDRGKQQPQQGLRAHGHAEGVQQGDHTGANQQGDVQPDPGFDRLELAQRTLGEERDHPAADQCHQRRDQPQTGQHTLALQGIAALQQAGEHQQIGTEHQRQHHHDRVVALLPHGPEHARHHPGQGQQEQQVQRGQPLGRQAEQPAQACRQPEQRQPHQAIAGRRDLPGPRLHGGEQKTGDDGHGEAEQHLVAVPGQPAAGGLEARPMASPGRHPERDRQQRVNAAGEKERAKCEPPTR